MLCSLPQWTEVVLSFGSETADGCFADKAKCRYHFIFVQKVAEFPDVCKTFSVTGHWISAYRSLCIWASSQSCPSLCCFSVHRNQFRIASHRTCWQLVAAALHGAVRKLCLCGRQPGDYLLGKQLLWFVVFVDYSRGKSIQFSLFQVTWPIMHTEDT